MNKSIYYAEMILGGAAVALVLATNYPKPSPQDAAASLTLIAAQPSPLGPTRVPAPTQTVPPPNPAPVSEWQKRERQAQDEFPSTTPRGVPIEDKAAFYMAYTMGMVRHGALADFLDTADIFVSLVHQSGHRCDTLTTFAPSIKKRHAIDCNNFAYSYYIVETGQQFEVIPTSPPPYK